MELSFIKEQNAMLPHENGIISNNGGLWPSLIWKIIINFFVYAVLLALLVLLIQWDAGIARENNLFSENSLTEIAQELFLVLIICLFYAAGAVEKSLRPVTVIMSAMFGCALIREFDSFFDNYLFDGAWQLGVTTLLAVMLFVVYRERRQFMIAVLEFVTRPPVGVLASGVLTVMVFSRFFGQQLLWKTIMGEGFMRSVKNAVEEGVELFGYYLCLVAAIEYARSAFRGRKKSYVITPGIADSITVVPSSALYAHGTGNGNG